MSLTLESEKVLLCVRADLDGGLGGDETLDGLPLAAVLCESVEEAGVFFLGPVLTALGEDVLLAGGLLGRGGGGR